MTTEPKPGKTQQAATAAQRKAAERQRHKDAGRAELRGIYTYPECAPAIKAHAAAVTEDAAALRAKPAKRGKGKT